MPNSDDLTLLVARARALNAVLATEDGESLIQGFKRAANILAQAEAVEPLGRAGGFCHTGHPAGIFMKRTIPWLASFALATTLFACGKDANTDDSNTDSTESSNATTTVLSSMPRA